MSKLSTIFLIAVLALGSLIPPNYVSSRGLNETANALEPFCGNPTTVRLLTEKNVDAGTVKVTNGETTLFVTFTTTPNYKLTVTHLGVASALSGIPVTSKKNPIPGQFPYQAKHNKVSSYTYEIPLNGLNSTVYIAAHADVLKTGTTKTEGAWGEGTPFVPGKRSWGMYFMYTLQPCNEPPVAVDDNYSTDEDTTLNVALPGILANDSDPDGDLIAAELVTTTANGTLTLNSDGSFTYAPDANYNGSDGFTYKARDSFGNLSNAATVAITINAVDDLPVAVDDARSVAEDAAATTFDILTNDSDADGDPFTIASASDPANGTVVVAVDGLSLTYQPDAGFCNDGSPTDDFTYSLTPGGSTATVAVTVNCVDDEPVAVNDTATVVEDSGANTINVLANDADPDGGSISIDSVTQPANGTVAITNSGADLTYTPDANYCNGGSPTDDLTYTLTPGGSIATVAVTVTCVDDAPAAVNDAATVAEDSGATAIDVLTNDTDVDGGPISVSSVTQPANGSVVITGGGTGLTYQPNANSCNDGSPTDDFTYTLTPGGSTATVAVTVTCVNDAPSFNLPASPNQTVIQDSGAQTVSTFATSISAGPANESGQTLTFNVSNNNNALFSSQPDIDESTGDLTYTPDTGATGSATVSVYLTDNGGIANGGVDTSATQTFTITVNPPNAAPEVSDLPVSTNEDTLKTITLSATDAEGDTVAFSIVSGPSNGSLGSIGAVNCAANTCTADVDYTPALNYNGSDSFTFKANDGQDSNTATVTITVNTVDDAPSAVNDAATVAEDSGATAIAVLANDTDPDGGSIGISSATQPANGTVVITGGGTGLTYQPNANYCNDGSPTDDFTYTLTPGGSSATVAVTVTCSDDEPSAVNDAVTVAEDAGATAIAVLANDTDPDGGPISITSVTQPANGMVVITGGGTGLTYQPNANYCNGGSPTDDFTYTLTPGGSTATVAVTVTCSDDAPTAVNDAATLLEDAAATTINVLANDTDLDGGPISIASVIQPANGTVVITNSGADLTYQPNANYCNDGSPTDDFTYTLTPGGSTATVAVTVTCVDDAPTAVNDAATLLEDAAATTINVLANDTDIDGGPSFSIASVTQPANGTVVITNSGADLTYQPNANYCNGGSPTDNFTYTLTPGGSTATVAVTVTCVNDAPVNTVPAAQNINEDTDLVFSTANSNALSVADIDAGVGLVQVTVSALNGTITPVASGATILGSGTASATITGTLTQVNAALNGLKYKGTANFNSTRGSETLTIVANDQGNTGSGGALSDTDTVSITVNAVNDAPAALTKNFSAQANMKITGLTGLLVGATDPDTGDGGYTAVFTVGTVSATTPAGGTITNLNTAAGSFDFDPPPGATGNVTFTYTVCDSGNPAPSVCSAPTTVTVNVSGPVIWFVNPAVAGPGDGRLSNPFNLLSSAAAVDASGHRIFVYTGTATSGITLNSDEWLIGQGVTGAGFDTLFGITPPTGTIARPTINGTRPVIQGNVDMTTSDVVRGLNIQPTSGTQGLSATGATSLTVNEVSVTTLNAAAVNLSSSGGTISLTTVNANGGSRGIVLNGTTGTFTVTGTGGTCTEANTSGCSGGVIQNMTGGDDSGTTPIGTGIVLNNAVGVSLTRMYVHDMSNYGIRGTSVNGFTLDNSVVSGVNGTNVASPYSDGSISFDNLSGTSSIANSFITGGYQRNIRVDNTTGTLTLTINNNSIHNTGATFGDDGVLIEVGGGNATLNVTNNTFAAHGGDHLNVSLLGTPTVDLNFTGNFWSGGHVIGLGQGLFILGASFNGTFTYDILNNGTVANPLVGNNSGGAIHVNKGSGTGTFSGTISNNVIGNPAVNGSGSLNASGIDVEAHGAGGSHTTIISNNLVRQFHNDGILLLAGEGNAAFNATVTGNTVSNPDASVASFHGIQFNIGTLPTDATQACLHVANNTLTNAGNEGNGGVDLRMRQRQLTTVRLPGYGGANNDNAAVQTFLTVTNSNALTTILASNSVAGGGGGFIGGAACPQP